MVFGFFKKKDEVAEQEEIEVEPVSFLGPVNGAEVNLKAHARLVEAGLIRAKELVSDALSRRADALRIEPKGAQAVVTLSVDGVPYPGGRLPKSDGLAVTQMLKLLAGLEVKERKAAQSGGIKAEFDGTPYVIDVRSSPLPDGERLIVRVRNQKAKLESCEELGMPEDLRVKLRELCNRKGVLIVTGVTGSGTTTTLYAVVRNIDAYIFTILSLGDTGGRKLNHVSPLEIQPGDDFPTTLTRAIRREANVILCEPLKEAETARVLFSKCEDLLFLTEMTSKDCAAAALQLLAWVGDPQPVAAGLLGILSQKLIRLLCPECRQAFRPKPDFLKKLGLPADLSTLYRKAEGDAGGACEKCGGIGYFGRTAMFEFLEINDAMRELLISEPSDAQIRTRMKKDRMQTLHQDGLRLVAEGLTSFEELQRVFKPAG
ncbi:MAG: ATPase, T2SS/T4P/T4SS family [Planctomycetaceae bacterium]